MNSVLTEGLTVMFIGMGTVLMFLCIMVFAMIIMSKTISFLNKFFPEAAAVPVGRKQTTVNNGVDDAVAAAIAAVYARSK